MQARSFLSHSIAMKILMALTGIVLIGFLVGHLMGNLLVFAGTDLINQYAMQLREYPYLLWIARIVLLLAVFLHIYAAVRLTLHNRASRPVQYKSRKSTKATLASRTMMLSGALLLFFICYHLAHLTFKWTHQEAFAYLDDFDVYSMLIISFQSSWLTLFYAIATVCICAHVSHGMTSFFQTIGWNHSKFNKIFRCAGPVLGFVLAVGFLTIPLSIYFKIIE